MSLVSVASLALAAAGIGYLILCSAMVAWFARRRPAPASGQPAVTILKPLHGAEPGLFENLASFARQDYGGPVQIILGVQSSADPAIPVVRELRQACSDVAIDLVVDARQHGTNRKVSNLLNMGRAARGEVVVLADSDMRVGPDYIARLVAELAGPGVGAVTCPYHGLPGGSVWSRLAALGIDTHFLPGVVVGVSLGLARPCMGSTIALRRETLQRIGGLHALKDALADDFELGRKVRALGLAVAVTPFTVGHACPQGSLGEVVAQELRWVRTIRQVEPAGHAGSLVSHPVVFALAGLALGPGPVAAGVLFTAIAARIGLCLAVERAFGLKTHPYWLVPARDILSFAILLASFFGRGVSWRGHHYQVARSGALVPRARPGPQ